MQTNTRKLNKQPKVKHAPERETFTRSVGINSQKDCIVLFSYVRKTQAILQASFREKIACVIVYAFTATHGISSVSNIKLARDIATVFLKMFRTIRGTTFLLFSLK